ncbi:hypothetical protein FLL45_05300 [Aliikangiella marina]|uniref:Polymerase nucleotidyl transferase domain-containing protein n=1 Tax=Aliikangiella marina TaxID=1712262 RepID=A0A545TJF5_9GAMM|nr:hypothetical protein [Aliikangiella marina]TQV77362.1 hypothetical protein FLL45_05300 [Aliikangiella marina]
MSVIKPIGELFEVDSEGFFINPCDISLITSPWLEVVNLTKEAYLANIANDIHSIYVRGSVAKGTAVERNSDIDTFAIIKAGVTHVNTDWFSQFQSEMTEQSGFHTGVEMGVLSYDSVFDPQKRYSLQFMIKLQTACIHGENVANSIGNFKPGSYLTNDLFNFKKIVSKCLSTLQEISKKEDIEYLCSWIMKKIIRTGFLLVAERENSFSRDLYPCYKSFSKYYPTYEPQMRFALESAIVPVTDKLTLTKFISEFGQWLLCEIDALSLHS